MNRHSGFTLINLIVLVGVVLLAIVLFTYYNTSICTYGPRENCGSNLKGLYQALYSYGNNHRGGWFPMAAKRTEGESGPLRGFDSKLERKADTYKPDPEALRNNVTASLWLLVRNKSMKVNGYICPATEDTGDPLTLDGTEGGKPAAFQGTADFFARKHLSYSPINMYHPEARKNWSEKRNPDWVLMADNNNADKAPGLHTRTKLTKLKSAQEIQEGENSRNHNGEGQNIMFADSSVQFNRDPFVGPNNDNVYADDKAVKESDPERAAPPTLAGNAPQSNPSRNVVLLPLSGNNGVNLDPEGK